MKEQRIGSRLCELRKNKGMTQKELAQRLNVSDKTVSHWERGDSNPDLQLLTVIADIFGVTCDELLKSEITNLNKDNSSAKDYNDDMNMLDKRILKFKKFSYISIVLFSLGVFDCVCLEFLSALIYPALKDTISFCVSTFFYAASITSQLIIFNLSINSINAKIKNEKILNAFKRRTVVYSEFIIGLSVLMFGLSIATLIKALAIDLAGKEMFFRVSCSFALMIIYTAAAYQYNKAHLNDEASKYNSLLLLRTLSVASCLLLCFLLAFNFVFSHAKPVYGYETISFNTAQEFKEYNDSLNIRENEGFKELELPDGTNLKYNSSLKIVKSKFSDTKDFFPLEIKIEVQKYSRREIIYFAQDVLCLLCAIDFSAVIIIYAIKRKKIFD